MKLLYVIHQYFPDCHSGTEQYCLAAAREARRRGDEVTILALHWDHDRDWPPIFTLEQSYDDTRVIRLNHWRRINPNDVLRDYDNRHLEGHFRAVLDDVRPDAVHFFHLRQLGSGLIPVAKRWGARVVVSLTDFWFLCPRFTLLRGDGTLCDGPPEGGRGCVRCLHPDLAGVRAAGGDPALSSDPPARLQALLQRLEVQLRHLRAADAVLAPSRFLARMFERNGFAARMQVVPYGLEPGRVHAAAVTRPRTPLRLAFCGVLSPWKAPHVVIDAVRRTSAAVTLTVHGRLEEPTFADYIADLRRRAGDDPRIRFAGPYDRTQIDQVFADMDLLVVPSTWYENTPFVVLEAFEAQVPVLASDLGGLSEVVQEGRGGWLFPAGDAAALAQRIERIAGDPGAFARLRPEPVPQIAGNYAQFLLGYRGSSR